MINTRDIVFIQPFFVKGIAHISYLLGDGDKCAIIDPARDVDHYIEAAESMGMKITHILETHLHADFISGHLDLADKTGAKIYAPKSGKCQFKHKKLSEDDEFKINNLQIKVLELPGHTPEGIAYVVTDNNRGSEPVSVFCGDTLFVGDVGRPDLFPGRAEELARKLYHSLHSKLLTLPDHCEVYPAHGAGSLCGRLIGAKRNSTIGYEKKYNTALQIKDKKEFIHSLINDMPPAPDHFSRCSELNRKGPALTKKLPELKSIKPVEFKKLINQKNTIVLDVRGYDAFGGVHVPGAYNISIESNFATFAGWVLPPNKKILLVTDSETQAKESVIQLRRVGLDNTIGYLNNGMKAWAKLGYPISNVCQISAQELHEMTKKEEFNLIDVRAHREYVIENIKGSINIPAPEIRTKHEKLKKNDQIVLMCNSGNRSSLAASLLEQQGFKNLQNVAGGMTGYSATGHARECPVCSNPHGSQYLGQEVNKQ